jgi:hypothetical protein
MATNIDDAGITFPDTSYQNAPTGIEDVIIDGTTARKQTIYIDTDAPASGDGANGDIWLEY